MDDAEDLEVLSGCADPRGYVPRVLSLISRDRPSRRERAARGIVGFRSRLSIGGRSYWRTSLIPPLLVERSMSGPPFPSVPSQLFFDWLPCSTNSTSLVIDELLV